MILVVLECPKIIGLNMKLITPRQLEILEVVKQLIEEKGYSPTHAEIAEVLDIKMSGVQRHLQALVKKGHISMTPGRSRSIVILEI